VSSLSRLRLRDNPGSRVQKGSFPFLEKEYCPSNVSDRSVGLMRRPPRREVPPLPPVFLPSVEEIGDKFACALFDGRIWARSPPLFFFLFFFFQVGEDERRVEHFRLHPLVWMLAGRGFRASH